MKRYIKSAILDPAIESFDARLEMANNPATDDDTLQRLAYLFKEDSVCRAILNNPNASDTTMGNVIYRYAWAHPYDKFYYWLADILKSTKNVNLINFLKTSAQDYHEKPVWKYLRDIAAKNPNCPKDILAELADDDSRDVRMRVVTNPNTSIETLEYLTSDSDELIRDIAVDRLSDKRESNT